MKLSYPVARILGSIAEMEALSLGVPMVMAVADENGGLLFFGRMDGALPASSEIAVGKAYTAAALRLPTEEVGKMAQPGGVLYGIQHTHGGRIVLFGGGMPLRLQGRVVGGIGISGGTVDEDIRVAKPVVAALEQMEALASIFKEFLPKERLPVEAVEAIASKIRREMQAKDQLRLPRESISLLSGALFLGWSDPEQPMSVFV